MSTFRQVYCSGLEVTGTLTYLNTTTLDVTDPLIKLGTGNTGTTFDLGYYTAEDTGVTPLYGGLFKDASTANKFRLFKDLQAEPTTTVNIAGTGYTPGTLVLGGEELRNPANTFSYIYVMSAIAADRNVTLPLLTGNDIFVMQDFIQTVTNKTATGTNNTLTAKFLRSSAAEVDVFAAAAPTAGQVLTASSGTAAAWVAPAGGAFMNTTNVAVNTTLVVGDVGIINVTTGATDKTITLPDPTTVTGYTYVITKVDAAAGDVIVDTAAGFIDDGATASVTMAHQFDHMRVTSNGTTWMIV